MSESRLPAHLEVSALIRAAQAEGGFATVICRGDREAGAILLLTMVRGRDACLWERLPRLDGQRIFEIVRRQDSDNNKDFSEYVERRRARDSDCWIVELDVADPPQFVAQFAR